MRMLTFARRNLKEILRDPLNLAFGLGFPLVLILLLSAIQANIPVDLFAIEHLAPGIAVFGLSFMTLFSATIIAKDRSSSLLQRLYTTPLTARDFILGYTLPIIPIALAQSIICFIVALVLGLKLSINIKKKNSKKPKNATQNDKFLRRQIPRKPLFHHYSLSNILNKQKSRLFYLTAFCGNSEKNYISEGKVD